LFYFILIFAQADESDMLAARRGSELPVACVAFENDAAGASPVVVTMPLLRRQS